MTQVESKYQASTGLYNHARFIGVVPCLLYLITDFYNDNMLSEM